MDIRQALDPLAPRVSPLGGAAMPIDTNKSFIKHVRKGDIYRQEIRLGTSIFSLLKSEKSLLINLTIASLLT